MHFSRRFEFRVNSKRRRDNELTRVWMWSPQSASFLHRTQNVALLDGRAVLLIRNPYEAAVSAFTHWEAISNCRNWAVFHDNFWAVF